MKTFPSVLRRHDNKRHRALIKAYEESDKKLYADTLVFLRQRAEGDWFGIKGPASPPTKRWGQAVITGGVIYAEPEDLQPVTVPYPSPEAFLADWRVD